MTFSRFRVSRAVPRRRALRHLGSMLALTLVVTPLAAEPPIGGMWRAQGPGPATGGQVENIVPDNQVVGAVHTVAAHPTDADTLYVGAVNGGIWKTTNATAVSPSWTQQTDAQRSLSIGALAFDPTDPSNQTLIAGSGRYSSLIGVTGAHTGLLRTTDGGTTWTPVAGTAALADRTISGIAPRGDTIVVSAIVFGIFSFSVVGIFRSTDGGATWGQVSQGNGTATGLPSGITHDLASDPSDPSRLYTSVIFATSQGGQNGIYRSDDTGATWTKVSDPAIDALLISAGGGTRNLEISVGPNNSVFAAIVNSLQLVAVFHSADGGTTWTEMDLPGTIENGLFEGIHPGGQGFLHLSIVADPTDPNVVYIGGDRQPTHNESTASTTAWPNSIGATDFTGRLFRGDVSQLGGNQWTPLTHIGTTSNSAPHADSREMTFDAQGDLIETDDGGIYRRTSPQSAAGDWFSLNGDLQSTEYHSLTYDSNADVVIGGAQDTGTTEQVFPDTVAMTSVSTGDGGDTAVDDHSVLGLSTRFSSFQTLALFRRRVFDASNVLQSETFPALTVLGGGSPILPQFYPPIAVNEVDGDRLIIGAGNAVYESLDQGDTVTEIGPGIVVNQVAGGPIVYGVPGNADLLYVADGDEIFRRDAAHPSPLVAVTSPGSSAINDLTVDPDSPSRVFAIDEETVYASNDGGASWNPVTGDLPILDPGELRSLAFLPGTDDGLIVGTDRGIFIAFDGSGFSDWARYGSSLPNAPVFDLDYDATDDVLAAGLIGRGAWKLEPATVGANLIFRDDFESGDTTAWSLTVP